MVRIDAQRDDALRAEAQVDVEHLEETSNEQPGSDEQHARKRDLRNNQRPADPLAARASRRRAPRRLECLMNAALGDLKRWHEPERDAGDERQQHRERQRRRVDADTAEQRQADRVHVRDGSRSQRGEREADERAARRQQHALRQQLSNEASTSGAERGADRHLLLAGRAGEEQIR